MKEIADNLKNFFQEAEKAEPQKENVVIKRIPGAYSDSSNNWKSTAFERRKRALERLRAIRNANNSEELDYEGYLSVEYDNSRSVGRVISEPTWRSPRMEVKARVEGGKSAEVTRMHMPKIRN